MSRKAVENLFIFLMCAVGLWLRFKMRVNCSLSHDELFHLKIMGGSFSEFIHNLPRHEFFSYLSGHSFLTYPLFQWFGFDKLVLAIPRVGSTILGFFIFNKICQEYKLTFLGRCVGFAVMVFNATLVYHAFEIRTYAFLPTMSLAVFYVMERLFKNNWQSLTTAGKFWLGAFFMLVIWFHVYGIVMIALCAVFFTFKYRSCAYFKDLWPQLLKFFIVVAAASMPLWLLSVFGPHVAYYERQDVFMFIPNPLTHSVGFLKAVVGNLVGNKFLYPLIIVLFLAFMRASQHRREQMLFLLWFIVLPIEAIMLLNLKQGYWFVQRHFIWVMPWFAFLIAWTADTAKEAVLKRKAY